MKYFKDENTNEVYAYDQGQIDGGWVRKGLVLMTKEEVHSHLNPIPTAEQLADIARAERDGALIALDGAISNPLRYDELSDDQKSEAATYRRLLLDVPQQGDFPLSYIMPTVPSWLL